MAPKQNYAAVVHGPNDLRLEERPIPEPAFNEVVLEIDCCGICGTDIHFLKEGGFGTQMLVKPIVLGHESSGIVRKVGSSVTHLKVGDRVAIEPAAGCRTCDLCKVGKYNVCLDGRHCTTQKTDGNCSNYFAQYADCCYKLPDHMTMEEGALLEPLAVAVYATRRADIRLGSRVIIFGAGPIGIMCLIAAKAMGATRTVILDLDRVKHRLDLAKKLGVTGAIAIKKDETEDDLIRKIDEVLGGPADRVLECTGSQPGIRTAIKATRNAGRICLVGLGNDDVQLPMVDAISREIEITTAMRFNHDFPAALEIVASGYVDVKPLVSHHFDLKHVKEAFRVASQGEGNKVLIHLVPRDTNNKKKFVN
ncbi:sorbitol dehydrogenase [Culex quinquefasciatus]|uniref:Sorbitol dehydrogenase n=1 Tax=Culex quinquefasciatus TaxID=7176 RepID=B0X1N9_CULQU|nr:sorbitol dehydrogenase-like [Culex pipiens pallens]EDS38767.1 sorbitol dehydrogenase [Culex quinquefasciatus]|eukprot:XP_001863561.1 sorbitol dehydrogenase [Culex quinquefasciatus]